MSGRIDILLRLAAERPESVLKSLETDSSTAREQDRHGYSLIHAAASYGHISLMKTLVQTYNVDPNLTDVDGESPLFYAESLTVAKCLVEELKANPSLQNHDGVSAADKIAEDGDGAWVPSVVEYLRHAAGPITGRSAPTARSELEADTIGAGILNRPEPLPENVQVSFGMMEQLPESAAADPEIKRRIEELAARGSLDTGEAQAELRALVTDIVGGMHAGEDREAQRMRLEE
jgi:hypothetical protein